jgi:hypothetical protein
MGFLSGGYASVVSQKRVGAVLTAASQVSVRRRLRTAAGELDTAGYRRFSGARKSQGLPEGFFGTRRSALILMGDWCVPAGHDNQLNEDRDAYHGQRQAMRRNQAIGPTGRESPREIFSLDKRGLMGDASGSPRDLRPGASHLSWGSRDISPVT